MATSFYYKQNNIAASGNWKETRGFFSRKFNQTASLGVHSGLWFLRKVPQFEWILKPYCASLESLDSCFLDKTTSGRYKQTSQLTDGASGCVSRAPKSNKSCFLFFPNIQQSHIRNVSRPKHSIPDVNGDETARNCFHWIQNAIILP